MDEEEYETYLAQIEGLILGEKPLQEQLYNEDGPVPGCYRTVPVNNE